MIEKKVKTLEECIELSKELKASGKKIVLCHGCFDITHYGHSRHFLDAREQGDVLFVTVTPDKFVQKGPGRPFFNQEIRVAQLSCLEPVDYVALNRWETAEETIRLLRPDIYAKGIEVLGNKDVDQIARGAKNISNLSLEEEALKSIGGRLYLTDEVSFSSSSIINRITSSLTEESKNFLSKLREKYAIDYILQTIDSLRDIKVLAIGDSFLDTYDYCLPLGKSGKGDFVSRKHLSSETHLGGVFAVANHIAGFVDNPSIITCIGNNNIDYVQKGLKANLQKNIFVQIDSETLIKKRYVDQGRGQKVFEVYNNDGISLNPKTEKEILEYLDGNLSRIDMVLISDFGHGMMSPSLMDYLQNSGKYLAINCQINGGNYGYNFITKYSRADFISINEDELRIPFQDKAKPIDIPIGKLEKHLGSKKINVTLGKSGIIYYDGGKYNHSPAFITEPLDTIGSGDAVLSLSSLLAYKDSEPDLIPFLGNCIGGIATRIIGNRRSIDSIELKKFVSYLMK